MFKSAARSRRSIKVLGIPASRLLFCSVSLLPVCAQAGTAASQPPTGPSQSQTALPDLDVRDHSSSADILNLMKNNPDKDESNTGKPRVFTQTTMMPTLQHRMIDSIEDYTRRVDAAVNFNATNGSINMRGLDRNRVLTTVDGIRTIWTNDGARGVQGGVTGFNFDAVGSIDVVKNANSSFFGTGALGGVVAINTLNPEDILRKGRSYGGMTRTTYDSMSQSAYLDQSLAARYKDTMVLLHGSFRRGGATPTMGDVGGTGTSRTKANPETYSQGSFLGKIHHYFGHGNRLELVGENFNRDDNVNQLTSISRIYNAYNDELTVARSRVSARYDYKAPSPKALISEAHLTAYWQKVRQQDYIAANRLSQPLGVFTRDNTLGLQSYGSVGSISSNIYTGPVHHALTLGEEVYITDTSQYAGGTDNCTPSIFACRMLHKNQSDMPNVGGVDVGGIVQDRMGIGRYEWLHLTPGMRFDYYQRNPGNSPDFKKSSAGEDNLPKASGHNFAPKFLVEARVAKGLTLYAQYAEAFRAPSATEMYLSYGNLGTYLVNGNPYLRPETSRGYEIGAKYGNSERGINVDFYDNYYRNFIDLISEKLTPQMRLNYPMGVQSEFNRQRVRIFGAEITAQWRFDRNWKVWTSLSYSDGRDTQENIHLNSVAPFRGITGVSYDRKDWGAMLSSTYAGVRNQVQDPTSNLNKVPGYVLFDLTAWYSPTFFPNLRLQAGIYNMFNKRYFNAVNLPDSSSQAKNFYSQPGRSFKVTSIITF